MMVDPALHALVHPTRCILKAVPYLASPSGSGSASTLVVRD